MPPQTSRIARLLSHPVAAAVVVALFVLAMSGSVIGLVAWKAATARSSELAQRSVAIENLAHSLADQASHAIQSVDVALSNIVDAWPVRAADPERGKRRLNDLVARLPQIRALALVDADGNTVLSTLAAPILPGEALTSNLAFHRANADRALHIFALRSAGQPGVGLSKRLSNADGSFAGVVVALINTEQFSALYQAFQLGKRGSVSILRADGTVLMQSTPTQAGSKNPRSDTAPVPLPDSFNGTHKRLAADGAWQHYGYAHAPRYPIIVAVSQHEDDILQGWRAGLRSDIIVAALLLCCIALLAALLTSQFRLRLSIERALRDRETRYRLLADNIADVVMLLDRDGKFLYVSPSLQAVLGFNPRRLIGQSCFDYILPADIRAVRRAAARLNNAAETRTASFRTLRADGSQAWVEVNFKLTASADAGGTELVAVLRDVTERHRMEDELKALNFRLAELATTDGLTELANRRSMDGFLRLHYPAQPRISLLLIDIDHFKRFNDGYGHQAGDACLQRVARVLADATSATGLAARYGGEEFAVILPGVGEQDAVQIAETIRRAIAALGIATPSPDRNPVTVSIGIASRTSTSLNEEDLLRAADLAMYAAKRSGRNRSVAASSLPDDGTGVVPLNRLIQAG
ncbi:MAG TPA: diguanylate cyclase [Rhodopseudomonas sp.]|uniref:diguanylate cyclase n=1 Tax=Rhodopseudomonas sp. TaxID=1078 RepID=UPI002EDAC04E